MRQLVFLAPSVALLFGCSGGGAGGGAVSLQPGQWEQTIQFTTIDIPGAPPEAAQMMRALMSQPQTRSSCMTPEKAANPGGAFGGPEGNEAEGCQFEPNGFAGGRINVRGTCNHPTRGSLTMTMTGSYTSTTMEGQVSQQMQAPPNTPGPQSIRLEGRVTGRRTGDCTAGTGGGNASAGNSTG